MKLNETDKNTQSPLTLKKAVLTLIIVGLPLLSINLPLQQMESVWYLRPFQLTAGSLNWAYFSLENEVRSVAKKYMFFVGINNEINELKNKIQLKTAQLLTFDELKQENLRLRELLQFKSKSKYQLLPAQVIGHDVMADHASIQIDIGKRDGVSVGQAVVSSEGVVGYITRVDPIISQVLLITDRYSVMDGISERSRVKGYVEGWDFDTCKFTSVDRGADIQVGDLILTSGLDPLFPKGVPIARVEKVIKRHYNVTLNIILKPLVNPATLEEVFIIQMDSQRSRNASLNSPDEALTFKEGANE